MQRDWLELKKSIIQSFVVSQLWQKSCYDRPIYYPEDESYCCNGEVIKDNTKGYSRVYLKRKDGRSNEY